MKRYVQFALILVLILILSQCKRRLNTNLPPITYWKDIRPIIENRCYPCHGLYGPAPGKFLEFNQVKSAIGMINYAVKSGYMPPWKADTNNSCNFANKRFVMPEEIEKLRIWGILDCPEGDKPSTLPEQAPVGLNKPDLILSLANPVALPESSSDFFVDVELPFKLPQKQAIRAIEVRSKRPKYAHHAIYTIRTSTPENMPNGAFDEKVFFDKDVVMAGGWAPGWGAMKFPQNAGFYLPEKGTVNLNMHYNHIAKPDRDSIEMFLWYANDSIHRVCEFMGIDAIATENIQLSSPFEIPAGIKKTFLMQKKLDKAITILSISPHMHLLGKSFRAFAITPQADTIKIISIPNWDFNWQDIYNCSPVLCLEKGTIVYIEATYDNTSCNVNNPSIPPKKVIGGWTTNKEMLTFIMIGMAYKNGDERLFW